MLFIWFGKDFDWKYDETDLVAIAGFGYDNGKGGLRAAPEKINTVNQMMLEMHLRKQFGDIFGSNANDRSGI